MGDPDAPRLLGTTAALVIAAVLAGVIFGGITFVGGEPLGDATAMGSVAGGAVLVGGLLMRRLRGREGFWATATRRGVLLVAVLFALMTVATTVAWVASAGIREVDGNNIGTTLTNALFFALLLTPQALVVAMAWTVVSLLRRRRRKAGLAAASVPEPVE